MSDHGEASHVGSCAGCGQSIQEGDLIRWDPLDGAWKHEDCLGESPEPGTPDMVRQRPSRRYGE